MNSESKRKLLKKTPTKLLMEKIFQMQKDIDEVDENNLDEVYELLSEIMSRNVKNIKISAKELEEILDFEDIFIFFNCYTNFISNFVFCSLFKVTTKNFFLVLLKFNSIFASI